MEIEGVKPVPLAYFISFRTYGSWMHGDAKGSIDLDHNVFGTDTLPTDSIRKKLMIQKLKHTPYLLDKQQREIVLQAIFDLTSRYNWLLFAVHIRTNHVHCLLTANSEAKHILTRIKCNASRLLNLSAIEHKKIKRWSRHGSTRYIWKPNNILTTVDYILEQQGTPMAWYKNEAAIEEFERYIEI